MDSLSHELDTVKYDLSELKENGFEVHELSFLHWNESSALEESQLYRSVWRMQDVWL